jgi:hypothetical protein
MVRSYGPIVDGGHAVPGAWRSNRAICVADEQDGSRFHIVIPDNARMRGRANLAPKRGD